jgi:excisionase family DNA binding protein
MPRFREPEKRLVYTIGDVAKMLGRDRSTIWRWIKKGLLREVNVPGGHRMVDARSVDILIEGKAKTTLIEAKNKRKGQGVGQAPKEPE